MSKASWGVLDTNVLVNSFGRNDQAVESRRFLEKVNRGEIRVHIDPLVIHELSYALPAFIPEMADPSEFVGFAHTILGMSGVVGPVSTMIAALTRWRDSPQIGFVDAYLAELALLNDVPVYTYNRKHFRSQGVTIPSPLDADRSM